MNCWETTDLCSSKRGNVLTCNKTHLSLKQNKWQILKRKLNYKLTTTSDILLVCAKLHNFIIDQQFLEKENPVIGSTDEEDFSVVRGVDDIYANKSVVGLGGNANAKTSC